MALLSSIARGGLDRELVFPPVVLRHPTIGDFLVWSALREESRDFLVPWEPTWPSDDLTRLAFRRRLRRYYREIREDLSYPFFVYSQTGALLGSLILSNVRRGVTQSGTIGYWIGERFAGRGYMTAAVRAVVNFAFDELALHRVEAACLPRNERSRRLLRRVGFHEEGLARAYLRINGAWEDHVLYALLAEDPRATPDLTHR